MAARDTLQRRHSYHLCFLNLINEMALHIPLNFDGEEVEIVCDKDTANLAAASAIFEKVRTARCDSLLSLKFSSVAKTQGFNVLIFSLERSECLISQAGHWK
jgi:hypothetical protein